MSYKFHALCAVLLCFTATPGTSFAKDPKRSFEVSVFSNYRNLPANNGIGDKTIKNVHAKFAGWAVTTDKLNGNFTDIFGSPITIEGNTNADKAKNCMTGMLGNLNVSSGEWQMVSAPSGRKADYVHYRQYISGHDVIFAKLSFRFT
jgi:hypothetical protein